MYLNKIIDPMNNILINVITEIVEFLSNINSMEL